MVYCRNKKHNFRKLGSRARARARPSAALCLLRILMIIALICLIYKFDDLINDSDRPLISMDC